MQLSPQCVGQQVSSVWHVPKPQLTRLRHHDGAAGTTSTAQQHTLCWSAITSSVVACLIAESVDIAKGMCV
jgi:hypothetical protein